MGAPQRRQGSARRRQAQRQELRSTGHRFALFIARYADAKYTMLNGYVRDRDKTARFDLNRAAQEGRDTVFVKFLCNYWRDKRSDDGQSRHDKRLQVRKASHYSTTQRTDYTRNHAPAPTHSCPLPCSSHYMEMLTVIDQSLPDTNVKNSIGPYDTQLFRIYVQSSHQAISS
jgi:hypothetical protein